MAHLSGMVSNHELARKRKENFTCWSAREKKAVFKKTSIRNLQLKKTGENTGWPSAFVLHRFKQKKRYLCLSYCKVHMMTSKIPVNSRKFLRYGPTASYISQQFPGTTHLQSAPKITYCRAKKKRKKTETLIFLVTDLACKWKKWKEHKIPQKISGWNNMK